jgi:UDP-glucose/iron transport system ATP-binding protein
MNDFLPRLLWSRLFFWENLALKVNGSERLRLQDVSLSVPDEPNDRVLATELNLCLSANDLIAINGPSGSGKSTLLRACIRMHPLEAGVIQVDGSDILDFHPPLLRQRIAYIRQFPVFSPGTVAESILEPFQWKSNTTDPPTKDQLALSMSEFGLDPSLLQQQTHKLSGGEAQRCALIRAILLKPDVLLFDESSANLDPQHEETFVRKVKEWVAEEQHAALWVTHNRELLKKLGASSYQLTSSGLVGEEWL